MISAIMIKPSSARNHIVMMKTIQTQLVARETPPCTARRTDPESLAHSG
jgi:hypothetical protein